MNLLRAVVKGYLFVGGIFAFFVWGSYMWAASWGMPEGAGFFQKILLNLTIQPLAVVAAAFRLVFWLPSLVIWMASQSNEYTFGMWLAPGLYTELIDTAQ